MRLEGREHTESGVLLLFDPSLLEHAWGEQLRSGGFDVSARVAEGVFLHLNYIANDVRVELFVDEPAPRDRHERATEERKGLLLRVPSGGLDLGDVDALDEHFEAIIHREETVFKVPPGDYVVDVHVLRPTRPQPHFVFASRSEGRWNAISHGLLFFGLGSLFLGGLLVVLSFILQWLSVLPPRSLLQLIGDGAVGASFLAIGIMCAIHKLVGLDGITQRARERAVAEHEPDVCLVMRQRTRIDEAPRGGGIGDFDAWKLPPASG